MNRVLRMLCALCVAFSCVFAFAANPPAASTSDNSPAQMLAALDAITVSKPDIKPLAELMRLRAGLRDKELAAVMDRFLAAELIIARRADVYKTKIKPTMAGVTNFEVSVTMQCQKCKGSGSGDLKCSACGGTGQCPTCKGAGKRLVNSAITTLKGPARAHDKSRDEETEITCSGCRGTGKCRTCGSSGLRKRACDGCGGCGKTWDYTSALVEANSSFEKLRAAVSSMNFEARIPHAIVTVKNEDRVIRGPAFLFDGRRVVAVSARSLVGDGAINLYSNDKESIPLFKILSSKNRDLALIDIGQTSIVDALHLENDSSALDAEKPVYAYGVSRDNDMALRLSGKVLAAGSVYVTTTIESQKMTDCAPLISDNGRLAGIYVYPLAERNAFGAVTLREENGCALRLDNILPGDFIEIAPETLRERNNTLAFAQRAIKAASDFVATDLASLKARRADISETIKRLDRASAMIKGIQSWDLYLMDATAAEIKDNVAMRAGNLEALLVKIDEFEAKEKAEAERKAAEAKAAEEARLAQARAEKAAKAVEVEEQKPRESSAEEMSESVDGIFKSINWRKVIIIAIVAIVVITVVFVLMGNIQDSMRRKKLAQPTQIPDFIREMQEYERKHKGKK